MTRHSGPDWRATESTSTRPNSWALATPSVAEQLLRLDCDPIAGMATLAQDRDLPAVLRARMFAELATYVVPRHKAMELTGSNGAPLETERRYDFKALSPDELKLLISLLKKADMRRTNEQL